MCDKHLIKSRKECDNLDNVLKPLNGCCKNPDVNRIQNNCLSSPVNNFAEPPKPAASRRPTKRIRSPTLETDSPGKLIKGSKFRVYQHKIHKQDHILRGEKRSLKFFIVVLKIIPVFLC